MRKCENHKNRYVSYLLCLWRGDRDGLPTWHASLESLQMDDRIVFGCLEDLFTYLLKHTVWKSGSHIENGCQPESKEGVVGK